MTGPWKWGPVSISRYLAIVEMGTLTGPVFKFFQTDKNRWENKNHKIAENEMTTAIQEFDDHVIDTVSEETQWYQYIRMLKSGNKSKIAVREYFEWYEYEIILNDMTYEV